MAAKENKEALARRDEPGLLESWVPGARPLWHEIDDMRREMDRLVSRFFGNGVGRMMHPEIDTPRETGIELYETDEALVLGMELPGVEQKDVDLSVTSTEITVSGQRQTEEQKQEGRYHWRRASQGSFHQQVRLPVEVKPDEVKATMKNGILRVTLPKAQVTKAVSVKVDSEQ